jgi:hypothetical protein
VRITPSHNSQCRIRRFRTVVSHGLERAVAAFGCADYDMDEAGRGP